MTEREPVSRGVWGLMSEDRKTTGTFVLPVGTVTFLLADVEGSTRQWEADGTAMADAMARLDRLVSDAVARHGGVRPIEQGEGDSFVAAFARASEAVACAVQIQQELGRDGLPRVRMGLHTGEAELRDETRYFGRAITRTARLRDLGHGGQVLLSRACVDLVTDHLPVGAALEDLGPHRMRDLTRAEQVFQLRHPDLQQHFPPLRSLDLHSHNLPVQLTSFVGRDAAISEIGDLITEHRIVTLTGPGGCGKTRLGLQVAAEALGHRDGGAWFVDLSGLADPDLVAASVMAALGLREVTGQTHAETLVAQLSDQSLLIVLDNCEHVLGSAAGLVAELLRGCGQLEVLATSREQLGIAGEVVWRVPSLTIPEEQLPLDIQSLGASEAVRLFIDRARAARPNFEVTNDNAPAVASICQHLDGIPLAIELAAARVRMMSTERITEALSDRFRLLAGGARGALPRQQTLKASVDWSYDLLPEAERALLRRLSVFAGGLNLDAAENVGVGAGVDRYDVLGLLSALVDKSLVQVDDTGDRYRLLETIRAYAGSELNASGEESATRDRHLAFFADLADRAEQGMWTDKVQWWLVTIGNEHDNLRAALDWSVASEQFEIGAGVVYGIAQFWYIRALRSEGRGRCEVFLAHDLSSRRRADLTYWAAGFSYYSDPSATLRYAEETVALGRETGDDVVLARGLTQVASVQWMFDPETALATARDASELARATGDDITVVDGFCFSSFASLALGRYSAALDCAQQALAAAEQAGLPWPQGFAIVARSHAALLLGELDLAARGASTLAELGRDFDDPWLTEIANLVGGAVAMFRGEASAGEALSVARHLAERDHDYANLPTIYVYEGALALALGDDESGCRILESANVMADALMPVVGVMSRSLLAEAALRRGDLVQAARWVDEIVAVPSFEQVTYATRARSRLARARADHHRARELAIEGLQATLRSGAQLVAVDFLELLAVLAVDVERYEESGRLFGLAAVERQRLGYKRPLTEQPDVDAAMARIHSTLSDSSAAEVVAEGTGLNVQEALDYMRRGRGDRTTASNGWASLTPTERKVIELVLDGLSNAEIGQRMFVSIATVKSHLTHVFVKLGVSNRRELAALAKAVMV
jgi:predicted ATPase/class 3 adenylate cyclase/DNA-binding CsgD family transcriptional regulator